MRAVAILTAPMLEIMFVGKDSNAHQGDEYMKIIKNKTLSMSVLVGVGNKGVLCDKFDI